MVVSPSVFTVSTGISSFDFVFVGNSSKTDVSWEKMSFPVSSRGRESSLDSVSAFISLSVKIQRRNVVITQLISINLFSNLVYLLWLTLFVPDGSACRDGGSFADLRRAVKVTTSDFGRLEHPLHRLLINTIKCF